MINACSIYTKSDIEIAEDYCPSTCFKLVDGKPERAYLNNNIMCFSVKGFDVYSHLFKKVCALDYFGDTELNREQCDNLINLLEDYIIYSKTSNSIKEVFGLLGIANNFAVSAYEEFLNEIVFYCHEVFIKTTLKLIDWIKTAVQKKGFITIEGI